MPKSAEDYGLKSDIVTYELDSITESYNIAWISDIHAVANYEGNWGDIKYDQHDWIQGRYDMFVSDDGEAHAVDIWDKVITYLNEGGFDAVIFGGDTLDYYSDDNFQILSDNLAKLNIPYMFIYGGSDHDADTSRAWNTENALVKLQTKVNTSLDLGEIKIVGILNSADKNGTEVSEAGSLIDSADKPVLVATHVPFDGASDDSNLESWCKSVHNGQKYYWARSDSNWLIQNNSSMGSFLNNYIYNTDSNVFGVVAGHVHMGSWTGKLTDTVKEHIFPATYRGYVGTIRIEGTKDDGVSSGPNVTSDPDDDSWDLVQYAPTPSYDGLSWNEISRDENESGDTRTITTISESTDELLYVTKEKTRVTKYSWDIVTKTEKRINYERFLGLWKNDTGKYYLDCQYEPNGQKVAYELPDKKGSRRYAVDDISENNGQSIDELIDLLSMHNDTQTQELLMKYYWNIYRGETVYEDVDLEYLLSLFDVSLFIQVQRTWCVWNCIYGNRA